MVSKEAEGDQEYKDLLNKTNTIIGHYRKSLKVQVLKCIDIEYKLLTQQIIDDFNTTLCFITKQYLVLMQDTSNINETRVFSILDFPKPNAHVCDNINAQINTSSALQQDIKEEMVQDDTMVNIQTQDQSQSFTTPNFNAFLFTKAGQAPATTTTPAPTLMLLNNYPHPDNTYMTSRTTPANDEQYARISFQTFYSKQTEPL
eukprot:8507891-Ditylum_brightwellii.AAC.1